MTDYYGRISPYDLGPNSHDYHRGVVPTRTINQESRSDFDRELQRRYLEAGACHPYSQNPILFELLRERQEARDKAAERERIIPIELAKPDITGQPEITRIAIKEAA